jgi:NAD(P)-dependent dehydrogenase (short-subunit alcohol dehydrogenase family)
MPADLSRKTILVTGAGGGIGRATCIVLAKAGARIVATDISSDAGQATIEAVRQCGGEITFMRADIATEPEVAGLVQRVVADHGRLDGAFNNAGVEQAGIPLHELTVEQWEHAIRIDLNSVFLCMKHQVIAMLAAGGGSIVNTASSLGQIAIPNASEYVAAKHGVIGLTRAGAVEYGSRGIRVNAVLPGIVRTPMIARLVEDPAFAATFEGLRARHPIGRFAEPYEIGDAVCWLLSEDSSFVNGAAIAVDGGALAN